MVPAQHFRKRYDQPIDERRAAIIGGIKRGHEEIVIESHLERGNRINRFLADIGQR
jgi:hypothetical protein